MHQLLGHISPQPLQKGMLSAFKNMYEIIEPNFDDSKCSTDQIFALQQVFKKSWLYVKYVYSCFVDLEKA